MVICVNNTMSDAGRARRPDKLIGVDPSGLIDRLQRSADGVVQDDGPDQVAVSLDDRVRAAETLCFLGIQRRMNTAKDDHRSSSSRLRADFISPERVAGMDAQSHDIAALHGIQIERLQGFIRDPRKAMGSGVAAARTNSQRGVITPTPNDR
jgi:hypothetical protein